MQLSGLLVESRCSAHQLRSAASLYFTPSSSLPVRQHAGKVRSRRRVLVRAEEQKSQDDNGSSGGGNEEARIAALEKLTRSKPTPTQRGRDLTDRKPAQPRAKKGDWREGELFPQGWGDMGAFEKAWQLWAGQRGFLFWTNKLAFGAIFVLLGVWILFRFVGPALGLYTLTNDLLSPPNDL